MALDIDIKPKSSNDSTGLMMQLHKEIHEKSDLLNKMRSKYAYEEAQKEEFEIQLKGGKTWFDVISSTNNIVSEDSKLRKINDTNEYFSALKSIPKYVLVLSCGDECSLQWRKFIEVTGLPLRTDVGWRESYVAVVDGGVVKMDQKSREELHPNYEFVVGHPEYSVEYVDGQLKVGCRPLRYCKIKVKSKGFTGSTGAFKSEIMVDNIDYSMNKTGINIVVINKETGEIVDSVNVNTYSDPELRINRV